MDRMENYITSSLLGEDKRKLFEIEHHQSYKQLSLFDDVSFHDRIELLV